MWDVDFLTWNFHLIIAQYEGLNFCFIFDHAFVGLMLIFSLSTTFSYYLIFLLLRNLLTPCDVLNLFLYFFGNTILKNNSNQLLVLGIISFSMCDNAESRSFFKWTKNFAISSGKCSFWLYNMLNRFLAFFIVSCLKISDILSS